MSLSSLQQEFSRYQSLLSMYADIKGYGLTDGDGYRDPRVHGKFGVKKAYGSAWSCHKLRLARDRNLFIDIDDDGVRDYITDGLHPAYQDLGRFWKALHPLARWGGDFKSGDANHFSFEYKGNK
jgi:hypothetical protein